MREISKRFSGIVVICLFAMAAHSQENKYPEVGRKCPDFTLSDVSNYSKKRASLDDCTGKWLVLDFWNKGCMGCLKSFPKMDSISRKFRDKMQFISVGYTGSQYDKTPDDQAIRILYERLRKRLDLHFAIAFDSVLFHQFGIEGCPYIVVVDPKGIVKAITYSLSDEDVNSFLSGKTPELGAAYNKWQTNEGYSFDRKNVFLVNGNGGDDRDFLFRSILTGWKKGMPFYNTAYFIGYKNDFFLSGVDLRTLYTIAYEDTIQRWPEVNRKFSYGDYWYDVVPEVSDSSPFQSDFATGKNLYAYNLIVPSAKANKEYMQRIMQRDLENYFGYSVTVEKRMMPCWKLVATPEGRERLKTKGDKTAFKGDYIKGFELTNQPVLQLIRSLWATNQLGPNFYDETGITGNIDIKMEKGTYIFSDAVEELRKNGLDLVKGEKEVKVIVIRDPKNNYQSSGTEKRGF
jgi:thiol-disulfide isomerase/thioredoxin